MGVILTSLHTSSGVMEGDVADPAGETEGDIDDLAGIIEEKVNDPVGVTEGNVHDPAGVMEEDDDDLLHEQFVDMNEESLKLLDSNVQNTLFFDETNLEQEIFQSEQDKSPSVLQVVIIVVSLASLACLTCLSLILIVLCRKYKWCVRKK